MSYGYRLLEDRIADLTARVEAIEQTAEKPVYRTLARSYATLLGADGKMILDFPVYATERATAEVKFSVTCPEISSSSATCKLFLNGIETGVFPVSDGKAEGMIPVDVDKGDNVFTVNLAASVPFTALEPKFTAAGYLEDRFTGTKLIAANDNWYGADYGNAITFYNGDNVGVFTVYDAVKVSAFAYGTALYLFAVKRKGKPVLRQFGILSSSFGEDREIGKNYRDGAVVVKNGKVYLFGIRGGRLYALPLGSGGETGTEIPLSVRASSVQAFPAGEDIMLLIGTPEGYFFVRKAVFPSDGTIGLTAGVSLGKADNAHFVSSANTDGFSVFSSLGGGIAERTPSGNYRDKTFVGEGEDGIRTSDGLVVRLSGGTIVRDNAG